MATRISLGNRLLLIKFEALTCDCVSGSDIHRPQVKVLISLEVLEKKNGLTIGRPLVLSDASGSVARHMSSIVVVFISGILHRNIKGGDISSTGAENVGYLPAGVNLGAKQ